ncbi:MAG: hypothetical protein QXP36_07345 [Conexivisphaerales archaeon]
MTVTSKTKEQDFFNILQDVFCGKVKDIDWFEVLTMEFRPEDLKRVVWYTEYMNPIVSSCSSLSVMEYLLSGWHPGYVDTILILNNNTIIDISPSQIVRSAGTPQFEVIMRKDGEGKTIARGNMPSHPIDEKDWDENKSELWQAVKQFEGRIQKISMDLCPGSEGLYYNGHMRDGSVYKYLPNPDFTINWYIEDDLSNKESQPEKEVDQQVGFELSP